MTVSDKDLHRAHAVLAEVVKLYDNRFWPLYSIIDNEVKERERMRADLAHRFSNEDLKRRRARRRKNRRNPRGRDARS